MQVELKKLAIYERMSQETTAFNADVYVDKKKVATAENDGHGGNTFVHWEPTVAPARRLEIEAELKKTVPAEYQSFTPGIEWAVDQAVEATRKAKEDARVNKAIAKNDAAYKVSCPKRGTHAARFECPAPGGTAHRWVEFKGDEEVAKTKAQQKFGPITNWTVIA